MKIRLSDPNIISNNTQKKSKIVATKKRKHLYKRLLIISFLLNIILISLKFL
jgi:hypothetical protein